MGACVPIFPTEHSGDTRLLVQIPRAPAFSQIVRSYSIFDVDSDAASDNSSAPNVQKHPACGVLSNGMPFFTYRFLLFIDGHKFKTVVLSTLTLFQY